MPFRNFLKSNRWKAFKNAFGHHSPRVAQMDYNATIIDYISELEQQVEELTIRVNELTGVDPTYDTQLQTAFSVYQGRTPGERRKRVNPKRSRGSVNWNDGHQDDAEYPGKTVNDSGDPTYYKDDSDYHGDDNE
jgi:hypothetical protein